MQPVRSRPDSSVPRSHKPVRDRYGIVEGGRLFQAIFESAAIGIVILDLSGRLEECNEAFPSMLGYIREDLLGWKALDLVHRSDRKKVRALDAELRKGESPRYAVDIRLKKKNRRLHWVRQTVNVIAGPEDEPRYLVTVEDIDHRVKVERNLASRAEDLARSNADLERFAYATSHDLREPMRTVSMFMQLLERKYGEGLNEEAREYIRYAVEGTGRMEALLQDLLAYSRAGTDDPQMEFLDFNEVLEQASANLIAESVDVSVLSEHLPSLKANRARMIQLFQNLIGNAIKFRGQDVPEIVVTVREEGDRWYFAVCDNGIGIPKSYHKQIFGLFERLNLREQYKGSGIGLAVCKRIVEQHGGSIWVESDGEGNGAVFHFSLKK